MSSSSSYSSGSSSSSSEGGLCGSLATIAMYKASVPADPGITDAMIGQSLMVASGAIRDYLFRDLAVKDRSQWFTLDGISQSELFLPEWPIVSVGMVGWPMAFGTLYFRLADGTATNNSFPTFSSDVNGITINWFTNGVKSTATYDFSSHPTYGDLVDAIQENTGWTVSWSSAQWAGAPSIFLRPVESQLCVQGVILESVSYVNATARLIDEFTLELSGPIGRWVFCSWRGGYELPTASHRGNLPIAISQACCNLAHDLLVVSANSGGILKGNESLGDWAYSLSTSEKVEVAQLVERQSGLLSKYRRMGYL